MNSLDPDQAQKIFMPELGLTACKVYQQTSVVQAHISHEISGFAFSDIKKNEIQQNLPLPI